MARVPRLIQLAQIPGEREGGEREGGQERDVFQQLARPDANAGFVYVFFVCMFYVSLLFVITVTFVFDMSFEMLHGYILL